MYVYRYLSDSFLRCTSVFETLNKQNKPMYKLQYGWFISHDCIYNIHSEIRDHAHVCDKIALNWIHEWWLDKMIDDITATLYVIHYVIRFPLTL